MFDDSQGFLSRSFLLREWERDYKAWRDSNEETQLRERLRIWSRRADLRERSSEGAFIQTFFVETWGYQLAGRATAEGFTAWPGYAVQGAGAGGSTGEADLALGWFGEVAAATPQVLCEFKDIRSGLDAAQARKGNTRTPVKQCLDYVNGARRGLFGNEPIQPWWGLASDMNEFRLYWWDRAPQSYLRFVIASSHPLIEPDLTADSEEARFDRFLFGRIFARDRLLSHGGRPALLRLIERQGAQEQALEGEFYADYKAVRERLFNVLLLHNLRYNETPGRLLRLAQKVLDRFIFAFYCEDMGERMLFPPQHIRDFLKRRSVEELFDEGGDELWRYLSRLFRTMDAGGHIGQIALREFNGGLFRADPEIDALDIPNHIFCAAGQGANAASIAARRDTFLHLCASYNFAARGEARESISLYTLGRIFEQSITELEVQEARLEGRLSLAEASKRKLPKRKRDGVYFTPEWVVQRVVEDTLGGWLDDQKSAVGWTEGETPNRNQLDAYEARISSIRVVDPACGSGAFLIGAFRRLLREREAIHGIRQSMAGGAPVAFDEASATSAILDANLFGVDINQAAVEIAKLALWLHSARADTPLSSLDGAIACGNSLVGPDYYNWTQITAFTEVEREQINVFDWRAAFPHAWEAGGFDVVVGNPPYVKLQNLRQVNVDYADYLLASREENFYASTQTGNFDLYLPFIEKGLSLLRLGGRMGYIAPSIWTVAEYGAGLRQYVRAGRQLLRWIDFKSHQIFKEATTYTALQFFSREPNSAVQVYPAPKGEPDVAAARWEDPDLALAYERLPFADPWLMATGEDRALIDRLAETCLRLDDRTLTTHIFQGLITSADSIFHLERLREGHYRCRPSEGEPYEVEVEDAIMRPLVSGAEAKRYEEPFTDTRLLFPYAFDQRGRIRLIAPASLESDFPKAWAYLRSWEANLRQRESKERAGHRIAPFDDAKWYRFGRSQNLDKQDRQKLIVPRIVTHLKCALDSEGKYYLDNVDVGGVLAVSEELSIFLNGVLNGPVTDFVFRRLSKPFANDYRSANKQFIAPLPIPKASAAERADIGRRALTLQSLITSRRSLEREASERLAVLARASHGERWLWTDLPEPGGLREGAPARLRLAPDRRAWADEQFTDAVEARIAALQAVLDRSLPLEVAF
ncbi:MAG TPA: DNA methyltransferase, partial [Caulobacteraceae bacterium]